MRPDRVIALLCMLLAVPAMPAGQEKPRFRQCQNYQLQGPIHTQLDITKKLNEDPPGTHTLSVRDQEGWLEFSPDGDVVEHGHVDSSGQPLTVVHEEHDAQGRPSETTFTEKERTLHYHNEIDTLPSGATETRIFIDGKLNTRIVNSYNPASGDGETTMFDKNGEVASHSISHRSWASREQQVWGKDGKLVVHTLLRYGNQGELIESIRFDAEGRVVSDFSFKDEVLTSWWQDPKCDCTNGAGFHRPEGVTVSYESTKEGKLLKNVQHHKGRQTNHEIDDEELYDENDHLLERIAYSYERDQYGNWTRRVASMLDIKTGEMIPVREDIRKLTYY